MGTWDVLYDDGEEAEGLCSTCVRAFQPYVVGEKADWQSSTKHYVAGRISAVNPGEDYSYDVVLENGRHVSNVSASDLRRFAIQEREDEEEDDDEDEEDDDKPPRSMLKGQVILRVGARVRAEYPGAHGVFPGVIDRDLGNDMFAIRYDDGDYSSGVHKSMIYV
jgi:hypothetical protein